VQGVEVPVEEAGVDGGGDEVFEGGGGGEGKGVGERGVGEGCWGGAEGEEGEEVEFGLLGRGEGGEVGCCWWEGCLVDMCDRVKEEKMVEMGGRQGLGGHAHV